MLLQMSLLQAEAVNGLDNRLQYIAKLLGQAFEFYVEKKWRDRRRTCSKFQRRYGDNPGLQFRRALSEQRQTDEVGKNSEVGVTQNSAAPLEHACPSNRFSFSFVERRLFEV